MIIVLLSLFLNISIYANYFKNPGQCERYLEALNYKYDALHGAYEKAQWEKQMGHTDYVKGEAEQRQMELQAFRSNLLTPAKIAAALNVRHLSPRTKTGLEGWLIYFEVQNMSSEAQVIYERILQLEEEIKAAYNQYKHQELRLAVRLNADENKRKAAFETLREAEERVIDAGYLDLIKLRNKMARALGYSNFFEYKIATGEGMTIEEIDELLDPVLEHTKDTWFHSLAQLQNEHGSDVKDPWNFSYKTSGDLTEKLDPYYNFENALLVWARTVKSVGMSYNDSVLRLDLIDRPGEKHPNGWCHSESVCWTDHNGNFMPGAHGFTTNVVPGAVGSGQKALKTFLHEGGHAWHFSNVRMPGPHFSQEYAPTSMAWAESHSQFMDHLMQDPQWIATHVFDKKGKRIPLSLVEENIRKNHFKEAYAFRSGLIVPRVEQMIYGLSDDELTKENVLARTREIEKEMLGMPKVLPTLAVPHLLSSESSGQYQGYFIGEMVVYQTYEYLNKGHGGVFNNPAVGKLLEEHYLHPGNSLRINDFLFGLMGEKLKPDATIAVLTKSVEAKVAEARAAFKKIPATPSKASAELDATVILEHGDFVISSNENQSFEDMAAEFVRWYREQVKGREKP